MVARGAVDAGNFINWFTSERMVARDSERMVARDMVFGLFPGAIGTSEMDGRGSDAAPLGNG